MALRSVFGNPCLSFVLVILVLETKIENDDELIWRWLDAALGAIHPAYEPTRK